VIPRLHRYKQGWLSRKGLLALTVLSLLGWWATMALAQVVGVPRVLPHRWFYSPSEPVSKLLTIMTVAAQHGLTGVVLHYGGDYPDQGDVWAKPIQAKLQQTNLEVIPSLFAVGYGGGLLVRNPEGAEGIQVKDALFVVRGTVAKFVTELPPDVRNNSFEGVASANQFQDWTLDEPGRRGFVDTTVAHSGTRSARVEVIPGVAGTSLVSQVVPVTPHRMYRISGWLKTRIAEPADDCIVLRVMGPDGRSLTPFDLWPDGNQDWTRFEAGFNSWDFDRVVVQAGSIGCDTGTIWVDDVQMEEMSMANVLHRAGTPFEVRDDATGTVYKAGVDYELPVDLRRNYSYDHNGPDIKLTRRTSIRRGQRLRVSYYHASCSTMCLSEPALYDELRKITEEAKRLFQPKRYLLNFSEIRGGGTCDACRRRQIPTAQIFGEALAKAANIIHSVDPQAEVLVYDDMFNPLVNSVPMYYLVDGDLSRMADYLPKEMILLPWSYEIKDQSVAYFEQRGFQMVGGAHYDALDLNQSHDWYRTLTRSPLGIGIVFYTWGGDYSLLGPFGDMVSRPFTETIGLNRLMRHHRRPAPRG
jgi:hypothetical protein